MKWNFTSLLTAAFCVAALTGTANAVVPQNSNNSNNEPALPSNFNPTNLPGQFNPTSLPGQEFNNNPFFNPSLFNPAPAEPTATPNVNPAVPKPDDYRNRIDNRYNPTFNPPSQPSATERRWRLGVQSRDTDTGVKIVEVVRGTAAHRAGLEAGDTIISVNGYQVGYVDGQLYDCGTEFERNTDQDGWVSLLIHNVRDRSLMNVRVQLDSRLSNLRGSVALQDRQNLPANAVLTVELQEIVNNQSAPVTIASKQVTDLRRYPIPFEIDYDPAYVSPYGNYVVNARIVSGNQELYRTTQRHQVLDDPMNPRTVAIQVERVKPQYNAKPIVIDESAQIAQIVKWFEEYLGRDPSDRELAVWLNAIQQGYPMSQVQLELLGHQQFFNRCNRDKQVYIQRVHELLIGRQPTRDEMNYWVSRYDARNGIRREIAREFQEAIGIN